MGTRRIIYGFALAGAAVFYALYPLWFAEYLFTVLLLLVPFDLIVSMPGMLTRRVVIAAPAFLEQGAEGYLAITTIQTRPFPARCIKVRLDISGDGFTDRRRLVCEPRRGCKLEMAIDTTHSGVTTFKLKRIMTVSLVGFFALPVRVDCKTSVLVMPAPVKPAHVASLPRGIVFYPKPGGGFSEDYDLRPYRAGDQLRNVHWKLSAKVDSLMVREPLVPPPHRRLVEASHWNGARERDLILGRLRWISDYLLKWDMPYYVRLGKDGQISEITKARDLTSFIRHVLSGSRERLLPATSLPSRFAWVFKIDATETDEETQSEAYETPEVFDDYAVRGVKAE